MKKKEAKYLVFSLSQIKIDFFIKEKKKKMEENKLILESLSKNILSTQMMDSFVSIKDLSKRKNLKKNRLPSSSIFYSKY